MAQAARSAPAANAKAHLQAKHLGHQELVLRASGSCVLAPAVALGLHARQAAREQVLASAQAVVLALQGVHLRADAGLSWRSTSGLWYQ